MSKSSARHSILFLCLALLLTFSSCQRLNQCQLTCRSEYLYPQYLASFQVNTPDVNVRCFYGQQIIIAWKLPRKCFNQPLFLSLTVRYGDRDLKTLTTPLHKRGGKWIFRLIGKDYWCKNGIISYKATIQNGAGETLEEWSHFLWAELIEINPDDY